MRDPRCKHEYLDKVQNWVTVTEEGNDDESDKHKKSKYKMHAANCPKCERITSLWGCLVDPPLTSSYLKFKHKYLWSHAFSNVCHFHHHFLLQWLLLNFELYRDRYSCLHLGSRIHKFSYEKYKSMFTLHISNQIFFY